MTKKPEDQDVADQADGTEEAPAAQAEETPAAEAPGPATAGAADQAPAEPDIEDAGVELTLRKTDAVTVEVPAEALEKAVTQLRELSELRRMEGERQERALAQMEHTIRWHSRIYRIVLVVSLLMLACVVGLIVGMQRIHSVSGDVEAGVRTLDRHMLNTTRVLREGTEKQTRALATVGEQVGTVRTDVAGVRTEQERIGKSVASELQTSRTALDAHTSRQVKELAGVKKEVTSGLADVKKEVATELKTVQSNVSAARTGQETLSKLVEAKLGETNQRQAEMTKTLGASVSAVREERDAVREEVKRVLDEHSRMLTERELALKGEAEKIDQKAEEMRVEKNRILAEAIDRLSSLTEANPEPGDEPAEEPAAAPAEPGEEGAGETPAAAPAVKVDVL